MKISDYDPASQIRYSDLLFIILENYGGLRNVFELEEMIGENKIQGITSREDIRELVSMADPLPADYSEYFYQFKDVKNGRGILEVTFRNDTLVNVRAQMFTTGVFFRESNTRKNYDRLLEAFVNTLGKPESFFEGKGLWSKGGTVIKTDVSMLQKYISCYLVHEEYY